MTFTVQDTLRSGRVIEHHFPARADALAMFETAKKTPGILDCEVLDGLGSVIATTKEQPNSQTRARP